MAMEQLFLLLIFLVFALGSHLMRILRKRMEERAPQELPPEMKEEGFPWPWPREAEPFPEPAAPPPVEVPAPPRRPAPAPPRTAMAPGPAAETARGPGRRRPLLTRHEARRGVVLREILGPCRGLEGLDTPDRVGGA
ncbi:MAG: hypothetical protein ACNA8S_10685 [Deferrisomatales bacterium]